MSKKRSSSSKKTNKKNLVRERGLPNATRYPPLLPSTRLLLTSIYHPINAPFDPRPNLFGVRTKYRYKKPPIAVQLLADTVRPFKDLNNPFRSLRDRTLGRDRVVDRLLPSALVCARRKIRREIIFAQGKGGSRNINRVHKHDETSKIKCR